MLSWSSCAYHNYYISTCILPLVNVLDNSVFQDLIWEEINFTLCWIWTWVRDTLLSVKYKVKLVWGWSLLARGICWARIIFLSLSLHTLAHQAQLLWDTRWPSWNVGFFPNFIIHHYCELGIFQEWRTMSKIIRCPKGEERTRFDY